ncbi:MAG: class I SAM-dependent methyltransferase [Bacteroidia bacterium]|jgi:SAM-dependent methyltransferase|nr:class I SAM-dependent methyltransferase [Bacteroidia bacterium]
MKKTLKKLLGSTAYIDNTDEYLNWLLVSNAGMQHKGNIYCFELAISEMPTGLPVLEIGAHAGLSANILTYLLQKHGRSTQVISVDPWIVRGYHDEQNPGAAYLNVVGANNTITRTAYAEYICESYLRNTAFFSPQNLPAPFRLTSDEFFESWANAHTLTDMRGQNHAAGGQFSFVYIDGNHDYDYCRRDFENAHRFLAPGGFILLDDSADGSALGSAKFAKELEENSNYRLRAKNPNRLFQKKAD